MRPDRARLADPYAKPATGETLTHVDAALRVVAELLLADCATDASCDLGSLDESARADVRESLAYLRDRVGVPRDMSYPAARCLRATLNHVSARLE